MDLTAVAGMIFTLFLAAIITGGILLFPLARRLGLLLEAKLQEKKPGAGVPAQELKRTWDAISALESQVKGLSERVDFTERLLEGREKPGLTSGQGRSLPGGQG
ncbi:MAG: hypothetical protein HY701_09235 [Gemmatimonadetes bacterium]|nr:hypothetical protein [Gemmatimonadota bacterium]